MSRPTLGWLSLAAIYPLTGNFLLPLCFAPVYATSAFVGTRWIFALPFSRRLLACLIVLPLLGAYSLTIVANMNWDLGAGGWQVMGKYGPSGTGVAPVYWQPVGDAPDPIIHAPWGETYRPEIRRNFFVRTWNPWDSGYKNTEQFHEWQYRRATLAIYGTEVPTAERQRLKKLRPLLRRPVEQLVTVVCVQLLCLCFMCMSFTTGWSRFSRLHPIVRKYTGWTCMLPLMLAGVFTPFWTRTVGSSGPLDYAAKYFADPIRANPLLAAGLIVLILGVPLLLLLKQFDELEPYSQTLPGQRSCDS